MDEPPPIASRPSVNGMQVYSWIETETVDKLLHEEIKIVCAVEGSAQSSCALDWILGGIMQVDPKTLIRMVHVHDPSKDYLPPRFTKKAVEASCEAKATSWLLPSRYELQIHERRSGKPVGEQLCEIIQREQASFMIMGFKGISGRKAREVIGSNVMEVMQRGRCSCVVFRTEDEKELPTKRPCKFVVSTGLNPAATKAFLDAVRLSKPGDEIHVVYIRPFLESAQDESARTKALREKYSSFFEGMQDPDSWPTEKMVKFSDRDVRLKFAPQGRGESVAQALVRYANNVEADFVLVGTNALRVERGKPILGSVSLQIIKEWDGNFVVSNFTSTVDS